MAYRMHFKALTKVVQLRMGKGLSVERVCVDKVNHKHLIVRRNRNRVRLLGMPLDAADSISRVVCRRNAQQNTAPESQMSSKITNKAYFKLTEHHR